MVISQLPPERLHLFKVFFTDFKVIFNKIIQFIYHKYQNCDVPVDEFALTETRTFQFLIFQPDTFERSTPADQQITLSLFIPGKHNHLGFFI